MTDVGHHQSSLANASEPSRDGGAPSAGRLPETLRPYFELPGAVKLLCLGSFINRAGAFTLMFLTIYASEQLGFGLTFATNCLGAFGVGSIVSSLAGGHLADTFGRKPVMLFALFGSAVVLLLLGQVQNRWLFLGLVLLFSLVTEMYRPAASAMVGDLAAVSERPHAFALMYISFNLGFAVAAPVGGFLAQYSFQWLFAGDALTTAVYGLIILFRIQETLKAVTEHRQPGLWQANGDASSIASAEPTRQMEQKNQRVPWSDAIRQIVRDRTFMLFCLATVLTSAVFMQAFSTLPIHLSQLGFSKGQIGWLMSTNGVLIVLCQIPVTHLLQRFDRVIVIIAGELLLALGFGLTTFAFSALMVFTTIVIWTLGEVVQAAFKQSMVADLAPSELRGRYMGVFGLCHAIGTTIGAPLGGYVLESGGPQILWPGCFVIVLLAGAVYAVIYRSSVRAG